MSDVVDALTALLDEPTPTTVVNRLREPFDVYIGRPSVWGNPFSHLPFDTLATVRVPTLADAIAAYEVWILLQPALLARLHELRGKRLGCWCKPGLCHGDVLARLADANR
jgi:hypothetical protein